MDEQGDDCLHGGVECETQLVCSSGCACGYCIRVATDQVYAPAVTKDTSDGYHTFRELYDHRRALTLALCVEVGNIAWRSKQHHPDDGPMFDESFIVGITFPSTGKTISYHYNIRYWDEFKDVQVLEHGPKWDGALPNETVERLLEVYGG